VNSFIINNSNIYCALDENCDNILIISLSDYDKKTYLTGHYCGVTDLTLTRNYLISTDIEGNIVVWYNNTIIKYANVFHNYINTVCEIDNNQIAVLCFGKEKINFYDLLKYSNFLCLGSILNIKGSGLKNNMLKINENILAVAGSYIYIIDLRILQVINQINCVYANDTISSFHFNKKGYFFISQALTHLFNNELEKGILGYYQYLVDDNENIENNKLIKLASKHKCHEHFIYAIKQIDSETIVTGSYDGKVKFWNLKKIE
jgi:WD40 repeat protein